VFLRHPLVGLHRLILQQLHRCQGDREEHRVDAMREYAGLRLREAGAEAALPIAHQMIDNRVAQFPKLGITSRNQLRGALEVEELSA